MKGMYSYYFAIIIKKGESGYVANAPGVGGVYEEGKTKEEAQKNAYESACAILKIRIERNDPLLENNKYLRVITSPPNLERIKKLNEIIPNGYIFTPVCAT